MRNKRKHVLTLILFCSLVFSIRAQQQHPYLFFTPDRIATLKEQLKSDKEVKANYAQVEQVAREALKEKKSLPQVGISGIGIPGDRRKKICR